MLKYQSLIDLLADSKLKRWAEVMPGQLAAILTPERTGDLPRWMEAIAALPSINVESTDLNANTVTISGATSGQVNAPTEQQLRQLRSCLNIFHPWRKGPFNIFDIHIDTEWRSDWKWERVAPYISDLTNRVVLDVGCGSGYHSWRMAGAGAKLVIGIDPLVRCSFQYFLMQHYIQHPGIFVLPLKMEDVPTNMQAFDSIFSMGLLYHRRSPFDHLIELKSALRPGGELILETLVIEGDADQVLVPNGRYAQMNNVWFLPSCDMLVNWCDKVGFKNIRIVDVTPTTTEEQRATEWMTFNSLEDFLDPNDSKKTIEGYPAPLRATLIAETPK